MKTLSIRFDIDTVSDIKIGVPILLKEAEKMHINFSFFLNIGRSFDLKSFIKKNFKKYNTSTIETHSSLAKKIIKPSIIKKIGFLGLIETIIFNPKIGEKYEYIIKEIINKGHEIGLHGGMNHGKWQYSLETLSKEFIENDFYRAYSIFNEKFGRPYGFCSPGFKYNKIILDLIDKFNFEYAGDMNGAEPFYPNIDDKQYKHKQVPVNIIGHNTMPIITEMFYLSINKKEIIKKVLVEMNKYKYAVIYGHPYFHSTKGLEILKEIILIAEKQGRKIITIKKMLEMIK